MSDDCKIERNLRIKQAAFFHAAEEEGFSIRILEAETGISDSTLRSYIDKPSRKASLMSLPVLIKLARVPRMPPHIVSLLIDDSGLDLVTRDPSRSTWLDIGEKAAAFASKVCRYQSTQGHIDHREAADLRQDMIEIISDGQGVIIAQA